MGKIKKSMQFLGKNPKKEFLFFFLGVVLILLIDVPLYLFKGISFLLAIPLFLIIFFAYFYFTRYSSAIRKLYENRMEEFIRLFTFLGIYINDGLNVYHAIESIQQFASPSFAPLLQQLVAEIEGDKSVTPFVNFAGHFTDISVKEVMISVYQMVDQGEGGKFIIQFQHLFGRLSDDKHAMLKQKRLDSLSKLSILPLIGSGVTMFMITFSLVDIMGGIMNVL